MVHVAIGTISEQNNELVPGNINDISKTGHFMSILQRIFQTRLTLFLKIQYIVK